MREDRDMLGALPLEEDCLWGVHTQRSLINFPISGRTVHPEFYRAMGDVKLACALQMQKIGEWNNTEKWEAIVQACRELSQGQLDEYNKTDALQGGAGTSLNMNVNEVIANRALQILGKKPGQYEFISPLNDINRHQSTNDTCPTALHLALIRAVTRVVISARKLAEAFHTKAEEYKDVLKIGRTQFQDAVVTSIGREMTAYARVIERTALHLEVTTRELLEVNLGGTAIGTCVGAPRAFVDGIADTLAEITGLAVKSCPDLVDGTQNLDSINNCSGAMRGLCASVLKVCTDLRLMSSGPQAGIGEIKLPERQAGSSIMPGKINPVIPETVAQVCMKVMGKDATVALAVSNGTLELNPFIPLISDCMLNDLVAMENAFIVLRTHCVEGLIANKEKCAEEISTSTALITAMVPIIGYDRACEIGVHARKTGMTIRDAIIEQTGMKAEEVDVLIGQRCLDAE